MNSQLFDLRPYFFFKTIPIRQFSHDFINFFLKNLLVKHYLILILKIIAIFNNYHKKEVTIKDRMKDEIRGINHF